MSKGSRSRVRTPEEKAARRCGARVTVWRAVHEKHGSREHVVVHWCDRIYDGHITKISDDGFLVAHEAGNGGWCSWNGTTAVEEPWWDVWGELNRIYPEPCAGCVALARRRQAA